MVTSEPAGTSANGRRQVTDVVKIVVLLRPPNFYCHCGGWLPSNLTVLSVVFLDAVSWKPPLTLSPTCDSHLNAASFDPVWMHGDTALLPRRHASASPLFTDHAARSAGTLRTLY